MASVERPETTLVLRGGISGTHLVRLAEALENAKRTTPTTVLVDLRGLLSWSLVAQAMLLSTARAVRRNGGELVLINPTPALRLQGARLGIFRRLATIYTDGRQSADGDTEATVALVAVHRRRALLLRSHAAPALQLPGGPLTADDDPRAELNRRVSEQLGITFDENAFAPFGEVGSLIVSENGRRVRTVCFQTPLTDRLTHTNGFESVWASSQTSGLFAPSADRAIAALHSADHID